MSFFFRHVRLICVVAFVAFLGAAVDVGAVSASPSATVSLSPPSATATVSPTVPKAAPPTVGSVSPAWFQLPPPGGPPPSGANVSASFNVTFTVAVGDVDVETLSITSLSIAGVPCSSLVRNSGGVVACVSVDAYAISTAIADGNGGAGTPSSDTYPIVVVFEWAGHIFLRVTGAAIFVLRATILSVDPTFVSPGGAIIINGLNFCPPSGCVTVAGAGIEVLFGAGAPPTYFCTPVATLSSTTISCTAPTVLFSDPHYPLYNVTVINEADSSSTQNPKIYVVYQAAATGMAFNATPLPDTFIPSDSSGPFALSLPIVMRVITPLPPLPSIPYTGPFSCILTATTPGASVLPIDLQSVNIPVQSSDNVVNFGRIGKHHTGRGL